MKKHQSTEARQISVRSALEKKEISQAQIAKAIGVGAPWLSKFLNESIVLIEESRMHAMEEFLGISFSSAEEMSKSASPLAQSVAVMVDSNPRFAKIVAELMRAMEDPASGSSGRAGGRNRALNPNASNARQG